MDIYEAVKNRHSVRSYTERKIEGGTKSALLAEIDECNKQSGLHIQLVTSEPEAFGGFIAHYGKFANVRNYIALVGKKSDALDERIGYYGERVALKAVILGLDTCWAALSFSKRKCACEIGRGETLRYAIAVGYGTDHGVPHKSKPMESLCKADPMPGWFRSGMEAAMLAPTAINQQKFMLTLSGNAVKAEAAGGFYSKVNLGIVKCHFEIGAGESGFIWA